MAIGDVITRDCRYCGKSFTYVRTLGQPPVNCSERCRLAKKRGLKVDPREKLGELPDTLCMRCRKEHLTHDGNDSCAAHTRKGVPCKKDPMLGQTVCRLHGGSAPQSKEVAVRRISLEIIQTEMDSLGGSLDVDPAQAMLAMVRESAWNVAFLRTQVARLESELTVVESRGGSGGAEFGGGVTVVAAIVKMYDAERDRLVRYSKLCRDAGVQERVVQIAEETGAAMVRMLDMVFDRLELTAGQQEMLPAVMGEVLGQLSGPSPAL